VTQSVNGNVRVWDRESGGQIGNEIEFQRQQSGLDMITARATVAALIADRFDRSVLVEGDAFFSFLRAGAIEPWLPESHAQNEVVTDVAAAATAAFVAGGYDTVYDGVMGSWFLPAFARRLGLAEFDYVVLLPSVEACVEGLLPASVTGSPTSRRHGRCTSSS